MAAAVDMLRERELHAVLAAFDRDLLAFTSTNLGICAAWLVATVLASLLALRVRQDAPDLVDRVLEL